MRTAIKINFLLLLFLFHLKLLGQDRLHEKLRHLQDSVKVGDMVIYNAFKYQLLAHENGEFDSTLILKKVYKPHPELWVHCLSRIFSGEMYQEQQFIEWNKTLFQKQKNLLNKLDDISTLNLDSLFNVHLIGLKNLTGMEAQGKWIVYAGPDENYSIFLGGCNVNGMAVDLAHSKTTAKLLTEALPHEMEHMVFEKAKRKDPMWNTSLGATLDEGVACFYTYRYFRGTLPKWSVIENMTKEEFGWYLKHEKQIFEHSLPYLFTDSKERNPYQCNCRAGGCRKLFQDAPNTLCYFLGFRIIEFYTKKHGKDSWRDIYKIPLKDFFEKSGYGQYIQTL